MKEELDTLIRAAVAFKPHADALADAQAKVDSARKDLLSVGAQLEKLREQVKTERNARALEAHAEKKRHDDEQISRQSEVEFVHADIDRAKTELRNIQNEIAKWQKKFEALAAKTTKLEKSLA